MIHKVHYETGVYRDEEVTVCGQRGVQISDFRSSYMWADVTCETCLAQRSLDAGKTVEPKREAASVYLIKTADMWDYIKGLVYKYMDHPECLDLFLSDWMDIPSEPTNIGWSADCALIEYQGVRQGYISWSIDRDINAINNLAVFVEPRAQNRGLGVIACVAVINLLLRVRGYRKISFTATPKRAKLYTRAGLIPVGLFREHERLRDGSLVDLACFEVFPEDLEVPLFERLMTRAKRVKFYKD